MIQTYGREYIVGDYESQEYIDRKDAAARECIIRHLVNNVDFEQPTTIRLLKEQERLTRKETFVRYRLETARVRTMDVVVRVPRESEYDRSLWEIARERLSMRWRRFKHWVRRHDLA